jgi:hypothetical protein
MALVHIGGYLRADNSQVNTTEVCMKDMENVHMKAEMFIKGSGRMESSTVKGHFYVLMGSKHQEIGCKTKDMENTY